jgi:hypothetical protein
MLCESLLSLHLLQKIFQKETSPHYQVSEAWLECGAPRGCRNAGLDHYSWSVTTGRRTMDTLESDWVRPQSLIGSLQGLSISIQVLNNTNRFHEIQGCQLAPAACPCFQNGLKDGGISATIIPRGQQPTLKDRARKMVMVLACCTCCQRGPQGTGHSQILRTKRGTSAGHQH